MAVQWLGLGGFTTLLHPVPGLGTKISQAAQGWSHTHTCTQTQLGEAGSLQLCPIPVFPSLLYESTEKGRGRQW